MRRPDCSKRLIAPAAIALRRRGCWASAGRHSIAVSPISTFRHAKSNSLSQLLQCETALRQPAVSSVVSSNCDYFLRSDFLLLDPIETPPNEIWHRACSIAESGRFRKKNNKEEKEMRIFKAALGAMVISVGLGLGGAAK